ncbi:MAG: ATP-dependent DNA helicase RecG [Luteitalea sp.]|nr:ATP-dependent DNA helicase RecG [Luteitalea sp.]
MRQPLDLAPGPAPLLVLSTPLAALTGVGPRRVAELARVGIRTVDDLLLRFPLRYEDRSRLAPLAQLEAGHTATVAGTIASCGLRPTRRPGFTIFEAVIRDQSGQARALWFNQRFLRDVFRRGQHVVLYGKVESTPWGTQLTNPQYEILAEAGEIEARDGEPTRSAHHGRIVPIYERIGALTSRIQRDLVHQALDRLAEPIDDPLPDRVAEGMALPARGDALRQTHFPGDGTDLETLNRFRTPAQVRLIFEEFFLFQLGLAVRRRERQGEAKPHVIQVDARVREAARAMLPFALTAGQRAALAEIVEDLQRPEPMHRLLQGDVGAGKTVVAALAAVVAMENDLQVAFMVPTELLAEQHARTLTRLLEPTRFPVLLVTGSLTAAERRSRRTAVASGEAALVVGTHALLEEPVTFRRLGFVVIDEQHRFGVLQRARLREKGTLPDVLVMTATPIPRTLALTVYGDLDVSMMRDRPPGRQRVKTTVRPEARRDAVHAFVRQELERGRQAYIVYPLVEESEKIDVRAATAMADTLQQDVFPEYRVGLVHGRLPADQKRDVMTAFINGDVDVLVSTTVVEVGVDVPNATVMVVEHAERFGLSQLHQLRGRVGRGAAASHCILLYQSPLSDEARARLKGIAASDDGFVIAEKDLELRGPGDVVGTRQSGLPTLRVGDLVRDRDLLLRAQATARAWAGTLADLPAARRFVDEAWQRRFGLVGIG